MYPSPIKKPVPTLPRISPVSLLARPIATVAVLTARKTSELIIDRVLWYKIIIVYSISCINIGLIGPDYECMLTINNGKGVNFNSIRLTTDGILKFGHATICGY